MRQMQVPRGPEDMNCPDWQKPMSEVCHKCPLWAKVTTTDNQTGQNIDEWNCAKAWTVILQIRAIHELNGASKEINALRNETKVSHDANLTMAAIAVERSRNAVADLFQVSAVPHHREKMFAPTVALLAANGAGE